MLQWPLSPLTRPVTFTAGMARGQFKNRRVPEKVNTSKSVMKGKQDIGSEFFYTLNRLPNLLLVKMSIFKN